MGLGFVSYLARRGSVTTDTEVCRALLPLHALFVVQLAPLPEGLLRVLSPGSYAAHFLPYPGDGQYRSISVSPGVTVESWLYVVGLQGLLLAVRGLPPRDRRKAVHWLIAVILGLAGEGLWQSRSDRPYWPLTLFYFELPAGLDSGVFGPYFNRNHFATIVAAGAGLAAGLAGALAVSHGGMSRLLRSPAASGHFVVLGGASVFLALTAAASGSRSGLIAAVAAVGFSALRLFGKRALLAAVALAAAFVVLAGASSIERMMRMDFMASRILPWLDMTTLIRFFPVAGSGIGTFGATYWPYQQNVTYEYWQFAHNEYLQMVIETGLAGLFVAWLVARRASRTLLAETSMKEGVLAALMAFLVQALLDFPFRVSANAAILTIIVGLGLADARDDSPGSTSR